MEESHIHKRIAATMAAADVIAGNADLLSEILLRLPARSLIRFSVVCKLWRKLIATTQFRLSHTLAFSTGALPHSGIYFYNSLTNLQRLESLPLTDNVASLPPLPFLDKNVVEIVGTVQVTQSCNGLIMCVITSKTERPYLKLGFVYNPAKKWLHRLPSPYNKYFYDDVYYNLIFDPSEPPYYKALCITRLKYSFSDFEMSVYVPGSESWRSCCRFSAPCGTCFDGGVFWNGAIHWVAEYYFIYFDAKSEKVGKKAMSPSLQGLFSRNKIRYFGEWGGHLHLIQVQSVYAKKFNVLELDKDTWKWSIKYRVHLARLISTFPEMVQQTSSGTQYAFSILSVIRGEKEEDSTLVLTIPGKVVAYSLVRKTAKVVCELPGEVGDTDTIRFNHICAYQYTESLAPIHKWTKGPK